MKGAGKGGDFNGNTVKDIIHDEMKLAHLEGILPENAKIFVDCLRGIADVHKVVTSPILDPDFESIIGNFVTKWKVLEDCFGIGCTLKFTSLALIFWTCCERQEKHFTMRVTNQSNKLITEQKYLRKGTVIK